MEIYKGFAAMYDELMANIPYEAWGEYITQILKKRFSVKEKPLVLDLACGTGNMTLLLANKGYEMIGADLSADMLAVAQQKSYEAGHNILFLAQDMRRLDLYGTIDAAVSVCDGLNYILQPQELATVFKRVRLFLNPGGVFIFDMNTEYKFKELLGTRSYEVKTKGGAAYEMDNVYDEASKINEYRVLFYTQGKSDHFTEFHKQRAYDTNDVVNMLLDAGFSKVSVTNAYTDEPPKPESGRLTYVAEAEY